MKKLFIALCLLLCGCTEKTGSINYKGVEITYREKDKVIVDVILSEEAQSIYGEIDFADRNYVEVLDEMDTYYVLAGKVFHPDVIISQAMLEECYQRVVVSSDNFDVYFELNDVAGELCVTCKEEGPLLIIDPVVATYQIGEEEVKMDLLTFHQVSELVLPDDEDTQVELVDVKGSFDFVNVLEEYMNEDEEIGKYIAYQYKDSIRVVNEKGVIYKENSIVDRSKYETFIRKQFTSIDDYNSNFYLYCSLDELFGEE